MLDALDHFISIVILDFVGKGGLRMHNTAFKMTYASMAEDRWR